MFTVPAAWTDFQFRIDARFGTIVKLTDGTNTWYFGDIEIDWGTVHVYSLLLSHSGIVEKVDVQRKDWSIGEVTFEFVNTPYRKGTAGEDIRPSEDLVGIINESVEVYILCGENATGTSDCLLRFKGEVKEEPQFNEETIRITVVDRGIDFDKQLPDTKVESVYSNVPTENIGKLIPLVYGIFKHDYFGDETGLARGIRIGPSGSLNKYVFGDHVSYSFAEIFFQESRFKEPSLYLNKTLSTNDSGRTTATMSTSRGIELYVIPDHVTWAGYNFSAQNRPANEAYAYNKSLTGTACVISDNHLDDSTNAEGEARFSFRDDEALRDILRIAIKELPSGWGYISAQYKIDEHSGATGVIGQAGIYYNSNGGDAKQNFGALTFDATWRNTTGVQTAAIVDSKNRPYKLFVWVQDTGDGDGTLNNQQIADLYEVRLRIGYDRDDPLEIFGEVSGREYGSWIDDSGRTGTYSQGDLIERPAHIVESILRDELGLTNAEIDGESFDNAMNTAIAARMNLTSAANVRAIIKQLSEQSTFAFTYSAAGKARLIDLDGSGSTNVEIPYSHVLRGSFEERWSDFLINRLYIYSRWFPQRNDYDDRSVASDATSESNYGTHAAEVYWPNISGSSVSTLAAHYLGTDKLWSERKRIISFETAGVMYAHLEIGDRIELEDTSWDAQVKNAAGSWNGQQFIVMELIQRRDSTKIVAIEL